MTLDPARIPKVFDPDESTLKLHDISQFLITLFCAPAESVADEPFESHIPAAFEALLLFLNPFGDHTDREHNNYRQFFLWLRQQLF